MYKLELSEREHTLLSNMALLAADKYRDNAAELRQHAAAQRAVEETGGGQNAVFTSLGYERLAEQFEDQEKRARELIEKIDELDG